MRAGSDHPMHHAGPAPAGEAIALDKIEKAYGATVALSGATFSVARGSVHALLGENGAGKSTIVKILSGLVQPDAGVIRIFGGQERLSSPGRAHKLGIQTAFQELSTFPDLTIWENLLIPVQPTGPLGLLRRRHAKRLVEERLAELRITGLSLDQEVRSLELPVRQKLEIARAFLHAPKIALLDEPTSSLSAADVSWLQWLIADQKSKGATIVFISHRMAEVRMLCDSLTVLRGGMSVGSFATPEVTDDEIIHLIIGRELDRAFPPKAHYVPKDIPALDVHEVSVGKIKRASLSLGQGEILGIAGLQGMGQLDLFLGLFGDVKIRSGEVRVKGKKVVLQTPGDAISAGVGIGLVPEERKTEGLFLKLDGSQNVSLPVIERFSRFSLIDRKAERRAVGDALRKAKVADRALYTQTQKFSGGNQQKIVLARWLLAGGPILLLYDPTRGVDVGTKYEIYNLINEYVRAGGSVLLYSTEIVEVVNLSHRVLVIYSGEVAAELSGDEISEAAIVRAALGGKTTVADGNEIERSSPDSKNLTPIVLKQNRERRALG